MAAIEGVYRCLVKLHQEYQKSGGKVLYLKVLELRQKLKNLVFQDWSTSDPQPPRQSRPQSERLETIDLTQDLPELLNADAMREMSLVTLREWRIACLAANKQEDLALWVHSLAQTVQASKQLRSALSDAQMCRASKVAKKMQETMQRFQFSGSVFDLPPCAGVLFQTVSEDDFFKMPVAEREKMSTQPLLIKGCSKLKQRLANIPQLQSQMRHFTGQFAKSINVQWTGRRRRDTSTKKQQPHRQVFTQGHQTHANLFSNAQPARDKVAVQPEHASTEVMNALAPYLPCARYFAESEPAETFVEGMTGSRDYVGVEFHSGFMAASRFQSSGRSQLWCASVIDACTAFRATGLSQCFTMSSVVSGFECLDVKQAAALRHRGLKLYHSIVDEGDVVFLPSGWLLAEKPLHSQMTLGIQVGAPPEAGSSDALMCIRDLLAFDNPHSSAVAKVDIAFSTMLRSHRLAA